MSSDETTGSGKIWSCEVSLTAEGYSERKPQLWKEKTWSVALCSKYVPRGTDMWTVHPQIQHVQSCTAWSHVTTRTRLAQELQSSALHIFVSPKPLSSTCVSRPLPHRTLTTSTSSLSPISSTSLAFPTSSPLHTGPMILVPYFPCDVPRQSGGSTQIPSLTGNEPKSVRSTPSTPKRSSLKTSSPEELSLTGILGQIRIKDRKDFWETLILKIWTNLQQLVQRCPTSSHRCIAMMTLRRAWQTRILKMENYEKC